MSVDRDTVMTHAATGDGAGAPDPTFYRRPADAIAAPPEALGYVAAFDPTAAVNDAIAVVDCDPGSNAYGSVIGWSQLPSTGNELHHFGWNACSSALCHGDHGSQGDHGGHGAQLERRYLVVPGFRSSRTYVLDTKPDPRSPAVVREIGADELAAKAGYSRPHTVHCGPGGIFLTALGGANGNDGPGGVALLDHQTFDVTGPFELDRGEQFLAYDVWWHLRQDTAVTTEFATPSMFEAGLNPEDLLGRPFGHHLNFCGLSERRLVQRVDLGDEHQMVLEVRPAHDPTKSYGFTVATISVEDLSASVWLWYRDGDRWAATKVITIPAEPATPRSCRPRCSRLARCLRWAPDSGCPSTTDGCTCPAGESANSSSTTSPTRSTRARPGRCASAGSSDGGPTPRHPTSDSPVHRRWWR